MIPTHANVNRYTAIIDNILNINTDEIDDEETHTTEPTVQILLSHETTKYPSTMENSFDIIMQNEDYTLGNILQHYMYDLFYMGDKSIVYCGFQKFHPHDTESVLRVAFVKPTTNDILIDKLKNASLKAIDIFRKIQKIMSAK